VQGPEYEQWDFSGSRISGLLRESKSLQLRGEFFNVFNHANFRLLYNNISSPNSGKIQDVLPDGWRKWR